MKRTPIGLMAALVLTLGCAGAPPRDHPAPRAPRAPRAPQAPQAPVAQEAPEAATTWRYALVIEGSSSASTLSVYRWRPGEGGRLPRIQAAPYPRQAADEIWTKRVRPGLSAHAGRPREAADSLAPLVDYALEVIPEGDRGGATIHLWATAGLRLLDPAERDEILTAVAESLAATPFASTEPRVISGEEEGVYGWLAVNYLLGHLSHGGPFPTVGALDLGGASLQITFLPLDYPREMGQALALGGNVYHLYTHSYLGLGQDVVREDLAAPACFLRGYPLAADALGTGDFDGCREAIRGRLDKPCPEPPCSGLGVYQPPVHGDFLAFSVYAYTVDFFGLGGRLTPAELTAAGREFCATSWPDLLLRDPSAGDDAFLPRYCFSAAYVVELLTSGFGFSPTTERIQAPLKVQGADTGWTLGALLYHLAGDAD